MHQARPLRDKSSPRTVAMLAYADLRHEWLLNLCIVLALAAVLAPLLLLLGLKTGTIETLRTRLVEDPVFRELKPQETLSLGDDWFARWAADPAVAFITPTILRGSSIIRVAREGEANAQLMDLLPTGAGDPLLLDNGSRIPADGEAVVSQYAAEKLKVAVGDAVVLYVNRVRGGRQETAKQKLEIAAVLPSRADASPRIYADLRLARDVESYRDGLGVPARGWSGSEPKAPFSFDGLLVVSPTPLDPLFARTLAIGTGFSAVDPVTEGEVAARSGIALPPGWSAIDVHVLQEPVPFAAIRATRDKLRGRGAIALPYVRPLVLALDDAGTTVPVFGLSLSAEQAEQLGAPPVPWGTLAETTEFGQYAQVLLPQDVAGSGERVTARVVGADRIPSFPLRIAGHVGGTMALVPAELAGALRTGTVRDLIYDDRLGGLMLAPARFRGFRVYARSIDDVAPLHRALREQGIETIAQVQAIERIRTLDRGLTRIFWLVAVVGIAGGVAALIASLYAAVERKARDLSMLRLMGLPRAAVFRFPIYQGAALAAAAALLAIAAYAALAAVINHVFAGDLALGEQICRLAPRVLALAAAITVTSAVLASLLAAWRTTLIDPAEAIRVE